MQVRGFVVPCAGKIFTFLGMSRVKRSFWKWTCSFFANVSCETLVLGVHMFMFWECLVWNARFGSGHFHFLRMSRVKRSFWESTFSFFANVSCETLVLVNWYSHFLRMSRVKRSFWKSTFSLFANVSCETLVLEVYILTKCLAWNARFGSGHFHFLRMSRVKRSFWESTFSFFANVSCETLVLVNWYSHFLRMSRVKRSCWKSTFSLFANVSCEMLVLEVYILTFCECLVWNARFGSLHSHFLRMSRVKRSFWKLIFPLFANVSRETLVLEACILSRDF